MATAYHRLGGVAVVRDVVDRFYLRVLDDAELRPYFSGTNMPRLKRHMVMLLCSVLGGPERYDGRDLGEAHRGMGITKGHYAKVGDHLVAVMQDAGVNEEILRQVHATLDAVEPAIVAAPTEVSD